ncbi:hypothetical protein [Parahaliea aestuarii]|uniref:Uncharacterized protein n=1 Tax=Parahaliea aestuarii TaxID=1852021 RepID=A0A5C9A505_9GAMM|nr:hypothetical protein [Parahaliea aestuarii]TXS95104.1 hypothetical protein FVW59_04190 [Parahaliea aestuarii]
MKKVMSMVVVVGLGIGSANVFADRGDSENLAACTGSVEQVLGQDVRTRLYGIQHRRQGDRLRLRVFPAEGESQTLSCWVDDEGGVSLQTADGIALRAEPASDSQRVTLSE